MKNLKKVLLSILVLLIVIETIIIFSPSKSNQSIPFIHLDDYYQIFYGEWIIMRMIPNTGSVTTTNANEVIGSTVVFDAQKILINDQCHLENPIYHAQAIPTSYRNNYFGKLSPKYDEDVLVLESPYFLQVFIPKLPIIWAAEFYVKDVDTLIFSGTNALYEAKRIGSIDDYKEYMDGV